jgi:hypothetical protein
LRELVAKKGHPAGRPSFTFSKADDQLVGC